MELLEVLARGHVRLVVLNLCQASQVLLLLLRLPPKTSQGFQPPPALLRRHLLYLYSGATLVVSRHPHVRTLALSAVSNRAAIMRSRVMFSFPSTCTCRS